MERGFLLLEVMLAIFLGGILWALLSSTYIGIGESWKENSRQFDIRQQQRVVIEEIIRKIRLAKPESIKLLEPKLPETTYNRVEMEMNHESGREIAFYQRGENILKGVKNPGRERFTGMSIALEAGQIYFRPEQPGVIISIKEGIIGIKTLAIPRQGGG